MSKVRFTAEEDERLIELVSSHVYVWNMKHKEFKNIHKKDVVWKEIGVMLNKTIPECQKRWKSIRDHYKRQRKEEKGSTGSAAKKKRANYWDRLRFLDSVEDERDSFSNVSQQDDIAADVAMHDNTCSATDSDEALVNLSCQPEQTSQPEPLRPSSAPPSTKRRRENSLVMKFLSEKKEDRQNLNNCLKEIMKPNEDDETDLFFKTIAMTVKKFKQELVTQTKLKMFQTVTEMEILNQQSQRSNSSTCHHSSGSSSWSTYQSDVSTGSHAIDSEDFQFALSPSPSNPPPPKLNYNCDIVNTALQYALNDSCNEYNE